MSTLIIYFSMLSSIPRWYQSLIHLTSHAALIYILFCCHQLSLNHPILNYTSTSPFLFSTLLSHILLTQYNSSFALTHPTTTNHFSLHHIYKRRLELYTKIMTLIYSQNIVLCAAYTDLYHSFVANIRNTLFCYRYTIYRDVRWIRYFFILSHWEH